MESLFFELGLVIISASLIGVICYYLKQPLILAYIIAGILIGPFGFGLVHNIETIHVIAQVGIMLMLFLVGLEMNPVRLKDLGPVAFITGVGQVIFTGGIGYLLTLIFGISFIEAMYLTIALTLSSTVIAVKLIYDKRDNNALYGQVAISILLSSLGKRFIYRFCSSSTRSGNPFAGCVSVPKIPCSYFFRGVICI